MELREILLELANRLLSDQPLYLVDIEIKGASAAPIIWIYLESEKGGVSIDACASLSREIVFHLDNRTDIPEKFTLNVSSPGLDRPLVDKRQFVSNLGRMAQVKSHSDGVTTTLKGRITEVVEDSFILTDEKGTQISIPFSERRDVKIIPAFK